MLSSQGREPVPPLRAIRYESDQLALNFSRRLQARLRLPIEPARPITTAAVRQGEIEESPSFKPGHLPQQGSSWAMISRTEKSAAARQLSAAP